MNQGDSFLGGGELHGSDHLWIVINDPAAHGGAALIVNVSTLRDEAELTCILKKGDHPLISHESYVRYASARNPDVAKLQEAFKRGLFRPQPAATPALVAKIRAGASASPMLPKSLLALL